MNVINLDHPKISPILAEEVRSSLAEIFNKTQIVFDEHCIKDICFDQTSNGRKFSILSKNQQGQSEQIELFIPFTIDAVHITKSDGSTGYLKGNIVKIARNAFQQLEWSAYDYGIFTHKIDLPSEETHQSSTKKASERMIREKINFAQKVAYGVAGVGKIVSFVLGKLQNVFSASSKIGSIIQSHITVIDAVASGVVIFVGTIQLALESFQLYKAYKEYQIAKKLGNESEMEIAKLKMIKYAVRITAALGQIALGILSIACPHLGLLFIILSICIFITFYLPDSALTASIATKMMKYTDGHLNYYLKSILGNEKLTKDEREAAASRFMHRILYSNTESKDPIDLAKRELIGDIFSEKNCQPKKKTIVKGTPTALRTPFAFGFLEEEDQTPETGMDISQTVPECLKNFIDSQSLKKTLALVGLNVFT